MLTYVEKSFVTVFAPRGVRGRVAMHSVATGIGAAAAGRVALGGAWWIVIAAYLGAFVGCHLVMVPFVTAWYAARARVERWIRAIVETELIRWDLAGYRDRLDRVIADAAEGEAPQAGDGPR